MFARCRGKVIKVSDGQDYGFIGKIHRNEKMGEVPDILDLFIHVKQIPRVHKINIGLMLSFSIAESVRKQRKLEAVGARVLPRLQGPICNVRPLGDYGFIRREDICTVLPYDDVSQEMPHDDVFVHVNEIFNWPGERRLQEGMLVAFYAVHDWRRETQKCEACDIQVIA
jgi:cold shock CspA family protein